MSILTSQRQPFFALLLILAASAGLYLPWIDNPLVFDDPNLLKSPALSDFAIVPFSLRYPRQFPYFTLGMEHVLSNGNLHVSRYVALVLHGLNGFLLFVLSRRLLSTITEPSKAALLAFAVGLLFVVHPVSVYAAGYLIQRTILFATFFLLLSAIQFDKALTEGSWYRAAFAGLCYGMAAISKEHAMPGFLAVAMLFFLRDSSTRPTLHQPLRVFLAVSIPIAAWITLIKLGYVATAYEPDVSEVISSSGIPDMGSRLGNWALSAALQCGFFFRYIGFWLWPSPAGMSIDIRPDFASLVTSPWLVIGPAALFLTTLVAFRVLTSKHTSLRWRLVAYCLTWPLVLFIVEVSAVRFQEAIVLYRSYLWAPGLMISASVMASKLSKRSTALILLILATLFSLLNQQILTTMSNNLLLWQDALNKAPKIQSVDIARIHYNIGQEFLHNNQITKAEAEFNWIIDNHPNIAAGYLGRSIISSHKKETKKAIQDLETVVKLDPSIGIAHLRLALLYYKDNNPTLGDHELILAKNYGYSIPIILDKKNAQR
jgi:tetratricopeptide (TPR) repeat protein